MSNLQDTKIPSTMNASLSHVIITPNLQHEKAYQIFAPLKDSQCPRTNLTFKTYPNIPIHDVRASMKDFTLDTHGFQFLQRQHKTGPELNWETVHHENNAAIACYLQQLQAQLEHDLAAEKVIIYDWRIRQNQRTAPKELSVQGADRSLRLAPARYVHADESGKSAHDILMDHLTPVEREAYLNSEWRLRILNVWKPLVDVVKDSPLTVCDLRTVEQKDWLICDQIYEDRVGESMYLKHSDKHKWYWLSNQTCDELTLFVVFDSINCKNGVCFREASVPHASFENPLARDMYGRTSIEIRSIICTKM